MSSVRLCDVNIQKERVFNRFNLNSYILVFMYMGWLTDQCVVGSNTKMYTHFPPIQNEHKIIGLNQISDLLFQNAAIFS
jgi:hypothetical protein